MKKVLAIVALVAAMFVAGKVQAQNMIYAGYAPESFVSGNSSSNYQGFFAGFTKNFGLSKGVGVAVGAQFRMNNKSESNTILGVTTTTKNSQFLVDVPILFNYGIGVLATQKSLLAVTLALPIGMVTTAEWAASTFMPCLAPM